MDSCKKNQRAVCLVDEESELAETIWTICQQYGWALHQFEESSHVPSPSEACDPGCIVLDIEAMSGEFSELVDDFNRRSILVPVIITAREATLEQAIQTLRSGAMTFLEKPCSQEDVEDALLDAMQTEKEQRDIRQIVRETKEQLATLTAGEQEVLELLMKGYANRRIATKLVIGLRTVEARRARIFEKLEAPSLARLIRKVLTLELSPLELKKV